MAELNPRGGINGRLSKSPARNRIALQPTRAGRQNSEHIFLFFFFLNDFRAVICSFLLTPNLSESRPKPIRKTAVRQHLQPPSPLFSSSRNRRNSAVIMLSPPTDSIHDVIGLTRVWFFQLAGLPRAARHSPQIRFTAARGRLDF